MIVLSFCSLFCAGTTNPHHTTEYPFVTSLAHHWLASLAVLATLFGEISVCPVTVEDPLEKQKSFSGHFAISLLFSIGASTDDTLRRSYERPRLLLAHLLDGSFDVCVVIFPPPNDVCRKGCPSSPNSRQSRALRLLGRSYLVSKERRSNPWCGTRIIGYGGVSK